MSAQIRLGDIVIHGPSGEEWVVLYCNGINLAPMGWPPCEAKVSDCTVTERCTDKQHARWIERLKASPRGRVSKALRMAGVEVPRE